MLPSSLIPRSKQENKWVQLSSPLHNYWKKWGWLQLKAKKEYQELDLVEQPTSSFDIEDASTLLQTEFYLIFYIKWSIYIIILFSLLLGYLFKYYEVYNINSTHHYELSRYYNVECVGGAVAAPPTWFSLFPDTKQQDCIEVQKKLTSLTIYPNPGEVLFTHYLNPLFFHFSFSTQLVIAIALLVVFVYLYKLK